MIRCAGCGGRSRGGAQFAVELHKLRKTGASRRYIVNEPLTTLMLELGHDSLATTQRYLADVRKPGEAKKAVADADFVPKPRVVKTGTDGDEEVSSRGAPKRISELLQIAF